MHKNAFYILFILIISCNQREKPSPFKSKIATDIYHGIEVKDPYRDLENVEDSSVVEWLKNQKDYTDNILESLPKRQYLIEKQQSYYSNEKYSYGFVKYTINGKYFYAKKDNKEEHYKLYYRDNEFADEVLIYDPSKYSQEHEYFLTYIEPDWQGNRIAIGLSKQGEEGTEIFVLDVNTKTRLPGIVKNSIPNISGISWLSDNSGFIYLYSPNLDPKSQNYWIDTKSVLYRLGSDPKKLNDVFSRVHNPELNLNPEDFPIIYNYDLKDGYLFAVVGGASSYYDVYYKKEKDLENIKIPWKPLYKQAEKIKKFRVDDNENLIYLSSKNTYSREIYSTPISNPDFENPQILVSQIHKEIITKFHITKDGIYFTTKKNGIEAKLYKLEGFNAKEIQLPKSAGDINIQSESIDQDFLKISARGFLIANTHYIYNFDNKKFREETIIPQKKYPDFDNFIVEHKEIPSHDGVLVPISIIQQKETKKERNNPTLFFGYGAYGGEGSTPFNPSLLTWVAEGGILVFAHVRGGGEKGDDWHKGGFKTTKPNTWKDMIACTEYMIEKGYTSKSKTAIWGSSAGGILAGRAMTERPDLYKAVILTSPALNMLRSEVQPNGKNSIKEFGTVKIEEEFKALYEMDTYHHVKKGVKYPATLVTGGVKDGRVAIWDPAKFVAKLQVYSGSDSPVLFDVDFDRGHAGMNTSELDVYELYADAISFSFWQMGIERYQPN